VNIDDGDDAAAEKVSEADQGHLSGLPCEVRDRDAGPGDHIDGVAAPDDDVVPVAEGAPGRAGDLAENAGLWSLALLQADETPAC
jgi:hypothetical protein